MMDSNRLPQASSLDSSKGSGGEDEELTIPRAAMNKLIKELVPDIRVANDSRELMLQCCSEFIRVVTSEANSICEEQQKKTMSPEHVMEALDRLGFSSQYKVSAESARNDCEGKKRRQSTRLEHLGIPEEELLRQQQELFARAKAEQEAREAEEWARCMQSSSSITTSPTPMLQATTNDNNHHHASCDEPKSGVKLENGAGGDG